MIILNYNFFFLFFMIVEYGSRNINKFMIVKYGSRIINKWN